MDSFNPAEAEEGFSSNSGWIYLYVKDVVSIQPKPKKGLVDAVVKPVIWNNGSFNPAEAEEGFSRGFGIGTES